MQISTELRPGIRTLILGHVICWGLERMIVGLEVPDASCIILGLKMTMGVLIAEVQKADPNFLGLFEGMPGPKDGDVTP